jgi:hypothetical protein
VTTLADAPKHCQEECQIRDPIAMEDDDQPQAQSAEEQKSN